MKKKLLAIIVVAVITCGMFLGCEKNNSNNTTSQTANNTSETNNNNTNTKKENNNDKQYATSNQQNVIQVPVTIINGTDVEFAKLYASSVNIDNWGNNLLGNGVTFSPGGAVIAKFGVDLNNLQWDFKAVDFYGNSLEFNGLDLSDCNADGITITLTYNHQTNIGKITAK